jgi:hypothetical protein
MDSVVEEGTSAFTGSCNASRRVPAKVAITLPVRSSAFSLPTCLLCRVVRLVIEFFKLMLLRFVFK